MRAVRLTLGALGLALLGVGAWHLLERPGALISVALWAGVPVVVHDAVLAPLSVAAGRGGERWLPAGVRGPVLTGAVVSLGLAVVALGVLGEPGAEADNPSLLPRDYPLGLVSALAVVWALVALAVVLGRRPSRA